MGKMIAFTTAACLVTIPAFGGDLLNACISGKTIGDPIVLSHCYGYVRGVADGLQTWEIMAPDTAKVCIPMNVTSAELLKIVQRRSAKLNSPFNGPADKVAISMMMEWPCKQQMGGK